MSRTRRRGGYALSLTAGVLGLGLAGLLSLAALASSHEADQRALLDVYRTEVRLGLVHETQIRLEFFFKNVYETARTVSLIPGVRDAKGGNRANADQDVVAQGRLDRASDIVIRNLYLNLASNFSISEIYAVLDGLDAGRGQVPFFMYDSVVTGLQGGQAAGADTPRANEDEEYAYFPQALAALKTAHPTYAFDRLSQIPVIYSPVMQTCDNTQYLSVASGDPKHTEGLISSVPLYGNDGAYKGLIAVIYRTDTLRAILLDLPFLPITDADKAAAKARGFDWPATVVPLVLQGPGLTLSDPRAPDLPSQVASAAPEDLVTLDLNVPGAKGLTLSYWLSPEAKAQALAANNGVYALQNLGLLVAFAALLAVFFVLWNESRRRQRLLDALAGALREVGDGDLAGGLSFGPRARGALERLGESYTTMVGSIRQIVDALKRSLDATSSVGSDLASSSEEASATLVDIHQHLSQIAAVVADLEGLITSTMNAIFQHSQAESIVRNNMEDLDRRVTQTASFVQMSMTSIGGVSTTMSRQSAKITTLGAESRDARNRVQHATSQLDKVQTTVDAIADTVATIGDITAKTKLLAMNAAIEAAHAGASGRGFAVVSQNIRSLAEETEGQSRAITEALADLMAALAGAREAQDWTAGHLKGLLDNFEELGQELTEVAENLVELGNGSHEVLADLKQTQAGSRRVVESLNRMGVESEHLVEKIQQLVSVAQVTTTETQGVERALVEVSEVVEKVSQAGSKNMAAVEALVRQAERFRS